MKYLFALLLLALATPVVAQTSPQIEAQITALEAQLDSVQADSTVAVLAPTVVADSTLNANGIVLTNTPHPSGRYDPQWIGIDLSALSAQTRPLLRSLVKQLHKGQVQGDIVRIRKDRLSGAMATMKNFLEAQ